MNNAEQVLSLLINLCDSKNEAQQSTSMKIGINYFIRTATYFLVGKLESITQSDFVLSQASWIPETGRFSEALKTGIFEEVEPFPGSVIVSRGGIIDACIFEHDLPTDVK